MSSSSSGVYSSARNCKRSTKCVSVPIAFRRSEYMSTVCQSLAKLLGHSAQLLEFDQIRTSLKSQTVKLPSELHKHKKLAWCVGIRPT